ncbi:DEAD-box ATP-dependent RNA helicase 20-like [Actinidia eriantha]|uniref:DEAD-box ATP-dependent RNA helicase 20-like n=1 Tax=Actinidia eriantha TaxID=165200 RepID=UPI00258B9A20|nr:DEAD-box ATP-dependent RNA helicase 20-like [Actinidia eriantha]XP_057474920.1 DEAD-box ATP-dependent RNA helicase 20-like [Actinidia eriantha]XP_057474922.1 DEAD-box ATP-dependent RNA helicase 20-like [Actinidia eriantha]
MSYVPPHLRNSTTITKATTSTTLETSIISTDHSQKLNSYSSQLHQSHTTTTNDSTKNSTSAFSNAGRRSSGNLAVPDPVFAQWKPSERVLHLTPGQIQEIRLRLNVDVTVASESFLAPAPIESFTDMCLHSCIMKDIAFHEYSTPTSIQAQAMPVALSGKDLLGCAETGSGKTAAFTIPMIQHCLAQPPICRGDGPLALVLAPTRELAQQIEKEVKAFSRSLESFRTAIVVGGTNIAEQRSELRAGVNIVVATPGRFIDHLQQRNTSLSRVSFVVLDEADRMLDMGFEPQIKEVMRNLPEKYQTLLFSATMPVEIEELAQEYLTNPVQVKVGKVSSPTANVVQILEKVLENEKIDRLLTLLVEESTQAERSGHPFPLTIVFVERKTRCDDVAEALVAQGLHAVPLHGGRSQSEREAALRDFRLGSTNILVATDVASRGLDVSGVAHVVNLDLPKTMEDYVHRIGRTGRAGSTGQATSFYTDRDTFLVAQIRKAIADVESGNTVAFATGKVARRKEREAAAAHKEARIALSNPSLLGPASINVEDKYRYMIAPSMIKTEGAADGAWDD